MFPIRLVYKLYTGVQEFHFLSVYLCFCIFQCMLYLYINSQVIFSKFLLELCVCSMKTYSTNKALGIASNTANIVPYPNTL